MIMLMYDKYDDKYKEVIDVEEIKAKIEKYKEKCKNCNFRGEICKELTKNYNCTIAVCLKEFYSLLEKEFPTTITKEELEKRWEG